jgi:hypothetical protein
MRFLRGGAPALFSASWTRWSISFSISGVNSLTVSLLSCFRAVVQAAAGSPPADDLVVFEHPGYQFIVINGTGGERDLGGLTPLGESVHELTGLVIRFRFQKVKNFHGILLARIIHDPLESLTTSVHE